MIKHNLRTSLRGCGPNLVEVSIVATFTGEGVTEVGVMDKLFTTPIREAADALAQTAAEAIETDLRDRETALRNALDAVLENVDPSQHAAITQRFGVSL